MDSIVCTGVFCYLNATRAYNMYNTMTAGLLPASLLIITVYRGVAQLYRGTYLGLSVSQFTGSPVLPRTTSK